MEMLKFRTGSKSAANTLFLNKFHGICLYGTISCKQATSIYTWRGIGQFGRVFHFKDDILAKRLTAVTPPQ